MLRCREQIESDARFKVTSQWINGNHQAENDELESGSAAERFALEDLRDVEDAHVLVFFSEPPRSSLSRGGRHVEFGYAMALGKTVIVVGPRENVFHCIDKVSHFERWADCLPWLMALMDLFADSKEVKS